MARPPALAAVLSCATLHRPILPLQVGGQTGPPFQSFLLRLILYLFLSLLLMSHDISNSCFMAPESCNLPPCSENDAVVVRPPAPAPPPRGSQQHVLGPVVPEDEGKKTLVSTL